MTAVRSGGSWLALFFALAMCRANAQEVLSSDTIAARIVGCWYAGDGTMRGYYCCSNTGAILVRFSGKGREPVESEWSVDNKGVVTIASGKAKTRYLVERLEAD